MKEKTLDLLVHPIRLRIVRILWQKQLTIAAIAGLLPDIPQATLYRHVNKLARQGIISVVAKHQKRGAVEKVYGIDQEATKISKEKFQHLSKEDHQRYFTAFIATLLGDFSRLLDRDQPVNLIRDMVAYRQVPLYLSDDEVLKMMRQINEVLSAFLKNNAAATRRLRALSTILLPIDLPQETEKKGGKNE